MLNEHYILGELPSSKLMKMKWNPLTGKGTPKNEASPKMKVYSWEKNFNDAQKNLDTAANIMSMKSSGGYNNVKKDVMKVQKALNMLRSKMKMNSTEF